MPAKPGLHRPLFHWSGDWVATAALPIALASLAVIVGVLCAVIHWN